MKTQIPDPKPEIRSPKETRNPKPETGSRPGAQDSDFGIRISFGLRNSVFGLLLLLLTLNSQLSTLFAQGTAFTYQGQLEFLGAPANASFDLTFSVWNGPVGPTQIGGTVTNLNVAVSNSLFTVTIDFGPGVFTGADRWLEISARTNGGAVFTTLTPRQPLTPTPYAITAANVSGGLSGVYTNAVTFNNAANSFTGGFTGNGAGVTNLSGASISSGTVADARLSANVALLNNTQTFTGAKTFNNAASAFLGIFTGNGAAVTNLNAANIAAGTLSDARLSSNVDLLNVAQTNSADKSFASGANLFLDSGTSGQPGLSFRGDSVTGILHPATSEMAFTFSGIERIRMRSGDVGLGTNRPGARLHVVGTPGGFHPTFSRTAVFESATGVDVAFRVSETNADHILYFERPENMPPNSQLGAFINVTANGRFVIGRLTFPATNSALLTPQLTLNLTNGNLGILRVATTNELEVAGDASKSTAGSWLANSDRRIKTNIRDIPDALQTVLRLHPVKFRYSQEWLKRNPKIADHDYYNFIAQEYRDVFPDAVKGSGEYLENDPKEILQLDTHDAEIVTLKAVQELIAENERRRAENAELRQRLERLEKIIRGQESN